MLWHDINGFYFLMEDTVFRIQREEVCGVGPGLTKIQECTAAQAVH